MYKAGRFLAVLICLCLMASLASCFPSHRVDSMQGQINEGNAMLTGLNRGITNLIERDRIGLEDSINYQSFSELARDNLDLSQAELNKGDSDTALLKWRAANNALLELQAILDRGERQ